MNNKNKIPTHKICGKCKKLTDMSLFAKNKMGKYQKQSQCKPCRANFYQKNKKELREQIRNNMLLRSYGIDQNRYVQLLEQQNSRCAICGVKEEDHRHSVLNVDHNHATKQVRGLLCNNCNRGLGHFKDSILNLENALNYLKIKGNYHE
jgi:hypothetical protein